MPRIPRYTDSGGLNPGRTKPMKGGAKEQYWCPHCDRSQFESKLARHRRQRVRCKHCGAYLHPLHEAMKRSREEKKALDRKCKKCKAKLRTGNPLDHCAICFNSLDYCKRQKALGIR